MSPAIRLFADLDRLAPGNGESLRWALALAAPAPGARVLDAGCGTGADLGVLQAAVPQGGVVAVDRVAAFVDRVRARYPRVDAQVADFLSPPGGPFDLIWSAGAVQSCGVEAALLAWRSQLVAGGCVGFSQICWRGAARPEPVRRFFEAEHGLALVDADTLAGSVVRAGYRVLGARWLGAPGWASYYGPLEAALDEAEPDAVGTLRAEIALWRTHGVNLGCRIIVCTPESV